MSKPLTIEQLKSLEVGDWVWLVENGMQGMYVNLLYELHSLDSILPTGICVGTYEYEANYPYSDYGKTWLAYKNKEQAEFKGEHKEYNEIYDYLYDYLNNAATCITQKDTNVVRIEVDAWLEFDLVIDLSAAKYFDNDTMTWKELRGEK